MGLDPMRRVRRDDHRVAAHQIKRIARLGDLPHEPESTLQHYEATPQTLRDPVRPEQSGWHRPMAHVLQEGLGSCLRSQERRRPSGLARPQVQVLRCMVGASLLPLGGGEAPVEADEVLLGDVDERIDASERFHNITV